MNELMIALRMTVVTFVLLGLAYPLAITGLAQVLFPRRANGSLVRDASGAVVGSELIGQGFTNPAYFQSRPSAAGAGYDGTSSAGSNFGPTSQKLRERIAADVARLQGENPEARGPVPDELVTASASGLDPHLGPPAARWQVARVAKARSMPEDKVRELVAEYTEGRRLGIIGERRVNVLLLNLALDKASGG